jgi:hypothetical protein
VQDSSLEIPSTITPFYEPREKAPDKDKKKSCFLFNIRSTSDIPSGGPSRRKKIRILKTAL